MTYLLIYGCPGSSHLLELNESIIGEAGHLSHIGYRYHFQDGQNNLVFRYDNTPHFPDFENFPHHKHFPDKVTGVEQPSILDVIEETQKLGTFQDFLEECGLELFEKDIFSARKELVGFTPIEVPVP